MQTTTQNHTLMNTTASQERTARAIHTASYLDSGFYFISDKAATDLCRVNGWDIPREGYVKTVPLSIFGETGKAELQRTAVAHCCRSDVPNQARGWVWAIYRLTPENEFCSVFNSLGREFTFSPVAR